MSERAIFGWIGLALTVPSFLWRGFVMSVLWNWFMPHLFGLRHLAISEALAVYGVVALFTWRYRRTNPDEPDWGVFGDAVFTPAMFLLFGWIVKQFALP